MARMRRGRTSSIWRSRKRWRCVIRHTTIDAGAVIQHSTHIEDARIGGAGSTSIKDAPAVRPAVAGAREASPAEWRRQNELRMQG